MLNPSAHNRRDAASAANTSRLLFIDPDSPESACVAVVRELQRVAPRSCPAWQGAGERAYPRRPPHPSHRQRRRAAPRRSVPRSIQIWAVARVVKPFGGALDLNVGDLRLVVTGLLPPTRRPSADRSQRQRAGFLNTLVKLRIVDARLASSTRSGAAWWTPARRSGSRVPRGGQPEVRRTPALRSSLLFATPDWHRGGIDARSPVQTNVKGVSTEGTTASAVAPHALSLRQRCGGDETYSARAPASRSNPISALAGRLSPYGAESGRRFRSRGRYYKCSAVPAAAPAAGPPSLARGAEC